MADASGDGGGRWDMYGVLTGDGKGESTSGSVRFAEREVRNAVMMKEGV